MRRVMDELLKQLGASGVRYVLQFHLGLPGVPDFDKVEGRAVVRLDENGIPVRCLCGSDLLAAKKAANRPQDQADIEFLTELRRLGKLP